MESGELHEGVPKTARLVSETVDGDGAGFSVELFLLQKSMCTIVLIRPGCTDFDEQQRIQGTLDLPLNVRGEQQVQQLVRDLQAVPLEIIFTSPSEPARSTAQYLGANLGTPVKELEGLENLDHGLWQGLPIDDIRRKHPKVFRQWQESPEMVCPPEGEMLVEVVDRVQHTLARQLRKKGAYAIIAPEPVATIIHDVLLAIWPDELPMLGSSPQAINGHCPCEAIEVNVPEWQKALAKWPELIASKEV